MNKIMNVSSRKVLLEEGATFVLDRNIQFVFKNEITVKDKPEH